ncbi:pyridoxal phosphate-dependent aminotransferase [Algihabitans albus]|uniref:pyridoxal phosphate-dependent aminotransferase n=1 Tax=Algihabitans albus TaxID=2164067 RepID=UPI001F36F4F5|nr:pyridoxal phosphate-dependent aminotransferase [Algihabitans albus]
MKIAQRGRVSPFIVMDVVRAANARAAEGAEVLHLEVGQPATRAPQPVLDAAKLALEQSLIGYSDALGLPSLRQALAGHYARVNGVDPDPDRIAITPGSSGGFLLAFLAAFEPGDRVALAAPGYPAYRNILKALDIEPVLLETDLEHRYQPTPALLRQAGRLDGLIVASPSNPTGTVLDRDALKALVDYCAAEGIRLVSDEIYHGITYGDRATSALELTNEAIVINSFSKYFCMTGWRLGWMVLPEDLIRPVECLAQNFFVAAPTLSQYAAVAAFDCLSELDARVEAYAVNRALLLERLPHVGFEQLAPADGAFYLYADAGRLTNDSPALCARILQETGVALTPGVDFDPQRGHRFVRFSFAGSLDTMKTACDRLRTFAGSDG